MNPYIEIVLKKMFNQVGCTYMPKYVITHNWFQKYWWTSTEEKRFKQWLLEMAVINKDLRQAMFKGTNSNTILRKAINQFINNFGWVTLYKNKFDKQEKGEPEGYYISEIKRVLSKKHFKLFNKELAGNTIAIWKGEQIVYDYDFERFLAMLEDKKR